MQKRTKTKITIVIAVIVTYLLMVAFTYYYLSPKESETPKPVDIDMNAVQTGEYVIGEPEEGFYKRHDIQKYIDKQFTDSRVSQVYFANTKAICDVVPEFADGKLINLTYSVFDTVEFNKYFKNNYGEGNSLYARAFTDSCRWEVRMNKY